MEKGKWHGLQGPHDDIHMGRLHVSNGAKGPLLHSLPTRGEYIPSSIPREKAGGTECM